jgi:cyclohexanecarboxylate-CoA ligase
MDSGLRLTDERIEAMTRDGLWQDRTVVDFLEENLRRCPDQTYVTDHNSMTGRSTTLSYRHLDRISRRIAAGLTAQGIGRGDVVAIQLPNWWEFAAVHVACVRIGAITNPLMPIFRERELRFMLGFADTKAIVIPAEFRGTQYAPMLESIRPELPNLEHVFVVGGEGDNSFEATLTTPAWEDEIDLDVLFEERRVGPNEVIHYCYTSGTSGQPKAVMHTYNTLIGSIGGVYALGLDSQSVVLMGSPLAHQTGFLFGLLMPITLGGRTVFMDIWNADHAAKIISEEGVTFTMGATPFLSDLTDSNALVRHPPDTLETFVTAGAPIPRPLVERAQDKLGAQIVAGWGMSENGLVSSTRKGDSQEKVIATDGKPWDGMDLRIVDEDANPVANGQEGRLQARGAANFVGYLKRPEAYEVDADGWFETGDNATMDDDGYVTLTGRAKDIIIRGGENIPVVEVEDVLYKHPGIREVAVVGAPDQRLGERGAAFVVLHDDQQLDLEQLRVYMGECQLAKQYWPERLYVVDDMPRTPSGKIQKFKLREEAATAFD